jgi:N12 class adenine-specific DNA methylase
LRIAKWGMEFDMLYPYANVTPENIKLLVKSIISAMYTSAPYHQSIHKVLFIYLLYIFLSFQTFDLFC